MSYDGSEQVRGRVDEVYRTESRRVLATLIRLLGDFDLAEEALHDAFAAALERWPREGLPSNPRAWLVRRNVAILAEAWTETRDTREFYCRQVLCLTNLPAVNTQWPSFVAPQSRFHILALDTRSMRMLLSQFCRGVRAGVLVTDPPRKQAESIDD